jgi:hypothetical protein
MLLRLGAVFLKPDFVQEGGHRITCQQVAGQGSKLVDTLGAVTS